MLRLLTVLAAILEPISAGAGLDTIIDWQFLRAWSRPRAAWTAP